MTYNSSSADFSGCLKNVRFGTTIDVPLYALFYTRNGENVARKLHQTLGEVGNGFGMRFGRVEACMVQGNSEAEWVRTIRSKLNELNGQVRICVCVLPDNRASR